ncbi:hypothetical protein [Brucella anthropi]|uniref:hypothetical protein n=1 Tax=Brucella anthropi TaxID=529 RepID=UPI00235FD18A|nr:hypothetical protein [Brucella anthropi]
MTINRKRDGLAKGDLLAFGQFYYLKNSMKSRHVAGFYWKRFCCETEMNNPDWQSVTLMGIHGNDIRPTGRIT